MVYGGENDKARMAWTSGFAPVERRGLLVTDYMGGRIVEFDGAGRLCTS
jgi:hypothetical protein